MSLALLLEQHNIPLDVNNIRIEGHSARTDGVSSGSFLPTCSHQNCCFHLLDERVWKRLRNEYNLLQSQREQQLYIIRFIRRKVSDKNNNLVRCFFHLKDGFPICKEHLRFIFKIGSSKLSKLCKGEVLPEKRQGNRINHPNKMPKHIVDAVDLFFTSTETKTCHYKLCKQQYFENCATKKDLYKKFISSTSDDDAKKKVKQNWFYQYYNKHWSEKIMIQKVKSGVCKKCSEIIKEKSVPMNTQDSDTGNLKNDVILTLTGQRNAALLDSMEPPRWRWVTHSY